MNKPLLVDTRRLRMLDKESWNLACSGCDKLQSKWEMTVPPEKPGTTETQVPICSTCFLYATEWGHQRAAHIREFLNEVMAQPETKRKMVLGATGELTNNDDADFVLGILALTSRRFEVEDRHLNGAP